MSILESCRLQSKIRQWVGQKKIKNTEKRKKSKEQNYKHFSGQIDKKKRNIYDGPHVFPEDGFPYLGS